MFINISHFAGRKLHLHYDMLFIDRQTLHAVLIAVAVCECHQGLTSYNTRMEGQRKSKFDV